MAVIGIGTTSGLVAASSMVVVTPDDTTWEEVNQREDGVSVISDEMSDRLDGPGSLRQSTTSSADKTDFRTFGDFGPVDQLDELAFDWYRDADSTAPDHLTPAFEVIVDDDNGNSWILKWEGVYNGYPTNGPAVPVDQWVTENLLEGNYWRIPRYVEGDWVGFNGCNEPGDPFGCFVFDRTLSDEWLGGHEVVGLTVGIGSGWDGTFISYADLVTINGTTFDFETEEPDVVLDGKDECFDGGWSESTSPQFRNQGRCVSYFQANERAGKR